MLRLLLGLGIVAAELELDTQAGLGGRLRDRELQNFYSPFGDAHFNRKLKAGSDQQAIL